MAISFQDQTVIFETAFGELRSSNCAKAQKSVHNLCLS